MTSRTTPVNLKDLSPEDIARALGRPIPTTEQSDVIAGPLKPTLVIAGAGAGKTETMAARVVYLVATGRARPAEILGLTFTRKAAQQLRRRIRSRLEEFAASSLCTGVEGRKIAELIRAEDPRISTYDSYAVDVLSAYGLYLPVEPDVRLLDAAEQFILVRSIVEEWDQPFDFAIKTVTERVITLDEQLSGHLLSTDDVRKDPGALADLVMDLPRGKGQRSTPNKGLLNMRGAQLHREQLLDVVDAVHKRMRSEGLVTFGQRMAQVARLVEEYPQVVEAERKLTGVVLLDEYQDTGQAQRRLLAGLFGGHSRPALAVTAVGDPMQSIYGWRGASASNLASFITDFPCGPEQPALQRALSTSWRNPPEVLTLANDITAQLRENAPVVRVPRLEPRPDAPQGKIRLGLLSTVEEEREWVATAVAKAYREREAQAREKAEREREAGAVAPNWVPPTAAVLIRRNKDAQPLAQKLQEQGLEVEILGSGGLLDLPEIADILALLRLAVNPGSDTDALRLLTGDRFRLGAADLAALSKRAGELSHKAPRKDDEPIDTADSLRRALNSLSNSEAVDIAGLADAASDLGDRGNYTPAGKEALQDFAAAVNAVRLRLDGGPAQALVAAESVLGLDVETRLRALCGTGEGRQQLDALHRYAADFSARAGADVQAFIDYLEVAKTQEKGLVQEVVPQPGRVQILTMHGAKGLEWEIIAIPHVARGIFPKGGRPNTWVKQADQIPVHLRGDAVGPDNPAGLPVPDIADATDRKELEIIIEQHLDELGEIAEAENRRLFYVGVTRSESSLFVSAHHWGDAAHAYGPSTFITELKERIEDQPQLGEIEPWICDPGTDNPRTAESLEGRWPETSDGTGATSFASVQRAAEHVTRAETMDLDAAGQDAAGQSPAERADAIISAENHDEVFRNDPMVREWLEEAAVHVNAARRRREEPLHVEIPPLLTATQHVALARDPSAFALNVLRPMPQKPNRFARRGTNFHAWVEHYFSSAEQFLIDEDDLPGAGDDEWEEEAQRGLREQFLASPWASREAVAVEVGFEITIGGQVKKGKMDAVFRDPEAEGEGWIVVDWKTGVRPDTGLDPNSAQARKYRRDVALQLAIYRLAWKLKMEERTGKEVPLESIRGAFHYIGDGDEYPDELPGPEELAAAFSRRFAEQVSLPEDDPAAVTGDDDDS